MRALIIDDSKAIRTAIRTYLTSLGFDTFEAEDGQHALQQLATHWPIDVATVDWEMPRMTGVEFVAAARLRPEFEGVKLLMVTTLNTVQQVSRALMAGADEYLMKPVSVEMLAEKFTLMGIVTEEVPAEA